jgi:hypothetical protein
MLGNLLGGFIVILVGVNLIPSIANQVDANRYSYGTNSSNITGASLAIMNLTTLFFALGIMAAGVSLAVGGLKNAGML